MCGATIAWQGHMRLTRACAVVRSGAAELGDVHIPCACTQPKIARRCSDVLQACCLRRGRSWLRSSSAGGHRSTARSTTSCRCSLGTRTCAGRRSTSRAALRPVADAAGKTRTAGRGPRRTRTWDWRQSPTPPAPPRPLHRNLDAPAARGPAQRTTPPARR